MSDEHADKLDDLLRRAGEGDTAALGELFAHHRDRLRLMVALRLDRRLVGRIDPSDVIQEAYLEATERFPDYLRDAAMPFFLWLRFLTAQRLQILHRRHLGAKARNAGREVSIYRGALPEASSAALAAQLVGNATTPSEVAMRAELQVRLQEALNSMSDVDREVLVLRHFEQLSNREAALALGIRESTASQRYARALLRLKDILTSQADATGADNS
jgi:RNA polymerase sigma-70 factor (ECF subfamily)